MSVELNPSSALGFHRELYAGRKYPQKSLKSIGHLMRLGPLTTTVLRTLTVTNPNGSPVIFKVKTTAPKQYCVRPNSGRIEPGEQVEVQVLLQPMKEDPPASHKCKDKFLVQSAIIPADRLSLGLSEMWSAVEKEDKSSISEQKIRCAFLPPVDESGESNGNASAFLAADNAGPDSTFTNAETSSADGRDSRFDSMRSTTTSDTFTTPARQSVISSDRSVQNGAPVDLPTTSNSPLASQNAAFSENKPISQIASEASNKPVMDTLKEAGTSLAASAQSAGHVVQEKAQGLTNGYTGSSGMSNARGDDTAVVAALRKELTAAEAEIDRLKMQLKDNNSGLRQRSAATSGSGTTRADVAALPSQKQVQGVPVQVTAGLCFGIFLFTWLFF